MNYSGYQIETLVKRFRRVREQRQGQDVAPRPHGDPLSVSNEARGLMARTSPDVRAREGELQGLLSDPVDYVRYPRPVELELERRAASFMPEDELGLGE